MRIPTTVLLIAALGSSLAAQTPTLQEWSMHPGVTSFTSRGNIGTKSGEIFQGVHESTNRGVLDLRGKCHVDQFSTITQDQNCSTRESFSFVVRGGDDLNGPLTGAAGVIGAVTGVSLPNSTSTTPCAWSVSSTLTASTAIRVPSVRHWSYGVRFNVGGAKNWTRDGQSVHATSSTGTAHRNHNKNEDQSWQVIGTATMATHPSQRRSWRISVFTRGGTVMKLRCGGRQGYGGSFPVASTSAAPLAWDARLNGGANSAGLSSIVAIGPARASAGAPLGRSGAYLYVHGNYLIFLGPKANASGVAVVPLLPHIPASFAGVGTFHLQGLLGDKTVIKLANSQSVKP